MDQLKIGKFIAKQRKAKNLTQMQLAEKLNITDKAISKWERGISMPDTSIMLELCDILKVSVKELLCGEVINMDNNSEKNEQLLLDMAKEIEKRNLMIWRAMWTILTTCIIGFLASMPLIVFFVPEGVWQIIGVLASCVVFLTPCFFALKLEVSVGAYKCKNCGNEIVPSYKKALNSLHYGTTRYLKCPKCGKRTWCKKVIKK